MGLEKAELEVDLTSFESLVDVPLGKVLEVHHPVLLSLAGTVVPTRPCKYGFLFDDQVGSRGVRREWVWPGPTMNLNVWAVRFDGACSVQRDWVRQGLCASNNCMKWLSSRLFSTCRQKYLVNHSRSANSRFINAFDGVTRFSPEGGAFSTVASSEWWTGTACV